MDKITALHVQESYWLSKALDAPVGSIERREALARYYTTHEERKAYLHELTHLQAMKVKVLPRAFMRKLSAGLLTCSENMQLARQAKG